MVNLDSIFFVPEAVMTFLVIIIRVPEAVCDLQACFRENLHTKNAKSRKIYVGKISLYFVE